MVTEPWRESNDGGAIVGEQSIAMFSGRHCNSKLLSQLSRHDFNSKLFSQLIFVQLQ